MTPAKSGPTNVVVVDGSNIATEGRSMPSLTQLNDAVMAFTEEFPDAVITVVVDATFGHRIDKKELAEFDAAVAHNEVVAPPAGAIGRGDAFVLSIANKVGARILSNDSFQEFHGDYPWLFDEGRLIGGKPVPFVGWVFVERLPVKGPVSRKATRASRGGNSSRDGRDGRDARPSRRTASREASLPMPVPTTPPPSPRRTSRERPAELAATADVAADLAPPARAARTDNGEHVNDLLPFLEFVEHHPMGSSVNGVVESYSSHGAYVTVGDVRGYVPLRLMGDPPPRSAREMMKLGDAVTLVVTSFAPARRSIDLAIPSVAPVTEVVATPILEELAEAVAPARTARRGAKKAAAAPVAVPPARRTRSSSAAATTAATASTDDVVAGAPARVDAAPAPAPVPAKRSTAKKAASSPAPARKATKATAPKAAATSRPKKAATAAPAAEATPTPTPAATPSKRSGSKRAAAPVEPAATAAPSADAPQPAPAAPARKRTAKKTAPAAPVAAAPSGDGDAPPAVPKPSARRVPRKRAAAASEPGAS